MKKKITLLASMMFAIITIHAQDYLISFAGSGASTTVDSVRVENLTKNLVLKIKGTDQVRLKGASGINESENGNNDILQIHPNPTTGDCFVDFEVPVQGKATFELYDLSGKKVLHSQETLIKGYHKYNLSGISSGEYFLRIISDKYCCSAKLVSSNTVNCTPDLKKVNTIPVVIQPDFNAGKLNNQNDDKTEHIMQYSNGDIMKFTGKSGIYRTVYTDAPAQSKTITFTFIACTDAGGNNYSVVKIGTQTWMAQNLNYTATTGWSYAYNNNTGMAATYGRLYDWTAALASCPAGWHLPDSAEWGKLISYLGGSGVAGGKLRETGTSHWAVPASVVTNSSGFTALPAGSWLPPPPTGGTFADLKNYAYFWSKSANGPNWAYFYILRGDDPQFASSIYQNSNITSIAMSVRCVKD